MPKIILYLNNENIAARMPGPLSVKDRRDCNLAEVASAVIALWHGARTVPLVASMLFYVPSRHILSP